MKESLVNMDKFIQDNKDEINKLRKSADPLDIDSESYIFFNSGTEPFNNSYRAHMLKLKEAFRIAYIFDDTVNDTSPIYLANMLQGYQLSDYLNIPLNYKLSIRDSEKGGLIVDRIVGTKRITAFSVISKISLILSPLYQLYIEIRRDDTRLKIAGKLSMKLYGDATLFSF